jgi:hypothetical protein
MMLETGERFFYILLHTHAGTTNIVPSAGIMRVEGSQGVRTYASDGLSGFSECWKQAGLGPEATRGYHRDNIERIRRRLRGRQYLYHPLGTIEQNDTPVRYTLRCERNIEHRGNTIFPRHNSAVGKIAAGLHHQSGGEEKQRSPARIGRGGN